MPCVRKVMKTQLQHVLQNQWDITHRYLIQNADIVKVRSIPQNARSMLFKKVHVNEMCIVRVSFSEDTSKLRTISDLHAHTRAHPQMHSLWAIVGFAYCRTPQSSNNTSPFNRTKSPQCGRVLRTTPCLAWCQAWGVQVQLCTLKDLCKFCIS